MTRRAHHTIDYDPRLDRKLPRPLGCSPIVLVPLVIVALLMMAWGVSTLNSQQTQPGGVTPTPALPDLDGIALEALTPTASPTLIATSTPMPTDTPDAWSATGTALAVSTASATPTPPATLDYCYWLTPSPTPSPTIVFPADAAGATALAQWLATNPARTATPPPPRELCLDVPSWTPTLTPFPLGTIAPVRTSGTPAITLPYISPPATWTPVPSPIIVYRDRDVVREIMVTSPPVMVTAPPIERIVERIVEILVTVEVPIEVPVTVEVPIEVPVTVEVPIYMTVVVTATPTETITP